MKRLRKSGDSEPGWWIGFNPDLDTDPNFYSIRIRTRIHKVIASGSNADPDLQQNLRRQFFLYIHESQK
jgi:hypothetical protein